MYYMKNLNKTRLIITTIILAILTATYFFGEIVLIEEQIEVSRETYRAAIREFSETTTEYIINKGENETENYRITPERNSTVFSLLQKLAKRENFKLEYTLYEGMGVFVEVINGTKNGEGGKYWQYWVNNKLGEVAADKKNIKGGDEVEWRFEVPAF
jgi:hypothetical protein